VTAGGAGAPPLPSDAERLLVVCPSWVGDTVMATPVLRAVREHAPRARIVAAVRPGLEPLLDGAPWIDEILPLDPRGMVGPIRAAAALRRRRPQAALLLPNSFRTALTVRLAGIPVRVGYDRDGRGLLLTARLAAARRSGPVPMVDYFLELARFATGRADVAGRLELAVTAAEEEAADALLAGISGPFALLNPGANRPDKRWPAERFARVADALADRHGLAAAVTGAPAERPIAREVAARARRPVVDLAARGVTLGSLKAVARRAALLVTNDTGPRHVAAALGTAVVTLFGPTDHRWTTLHAPHERLLLAEPFLPEEEIADRHPALCAIERITVGDVLAACAALLDASRAGRGAAPPAPR
jgi:heptosyltransferase-2